VSAPDRVIRSGQMDPLHARWWRLCWLPALLGCGGPAPAAVVPSDPVTTTVAEAAATVDDRPRLLDLLSDEPDEARRVRVAWLGAVRFAEDGAVIVPDQDVPRSWRWTEYVVADEGASRIRVVAEHDGVRLLLWIEREDAGVTNVEATGVAMEPEGQTPRPGEPGLFLDPGALLDFEREEGGPWRVSLEAQLTFAGWVPEGVVGHVYVPLPVQPMDGDEGEATTSLLGEVRDAPAEDGRVLASVENLAVRRLGPAVGGWQEIGLEDGRVRLRGFVRTSDLVAEAIGSGRGGMRGGARPETTLPADSCLFAGPGGALIGKTVRDLAVSATARAEGGWERFPVGSEWGAVDAWAHRTRDAAGWEVCP
jgi:hypothetical protein